MRYVIVLAVSILVSFSPVKCQSDTLIGYSFADNTDLNFYADFGLSGNLFNSIIASDSSGNLRVPTYTNGATDYAATADTWEDGAGNKFWQIEFNADGFRDFKLYSKQRSGGNNPGPANWKIQAKIEGGIFEDISGGTVTVANDFTTGVINGIDLPPAFNNPGNNKIYIRWIMTDNTNSNGGTLAAAGISKIDDIFVTGVSITNIDLNGITKALIFPNPAKEVLYFNENIVPCKITLTDANGRVLKENKETFNGSIDIRDLTPGVYLLMYYDNECGKNKQEKIIVL